MPDLRTVVAHQLQITRDLLRAAATSTADDAAVPLIADTAIDEALPIGWLRARLGLSTTEEQVLWVLIAHELDPAARRLVRELNTEDVADPTLDAVRRTVYGSLPDARAWRELSADGALQRLGLIERTDDGAATPEHRRTYRAAARVIALVHGAVALDAELADCATLDVGAPSLDALEVAPEIVQRLEAAIDGGNMIVLHGAAGTGRRSLLAALAARRGHALLQVDARSLATDRERARRQLRVIARECVLLRRVPLVLHLDALAAVGETADRMDLVEHELGGLVLATASRAPARRWKRAPTIVALPPLKAAQRASLWKRALVEASDADAELLANMYPLAPALVDAVGAVARREAADTAMRPEHVEAGVRAVLDDRLAGLATRITVTQTWEDLILPDDQTTAVIELLARIRQRPRVYEQWGFADKLGKGLGVSALFSGPPGTGKTMCASLIARDLGTELYQVDLSKIASKWIGETEKNLAALFDAAEAGHAILLFDEADALFGKRTQVTTSNDRRANQEVNYLLQRLESFAGICLLTTNHESAIDEAFRRRLSVHVRFPVPDTDERAKLWSTMLPARAPVAPDLPFAELARKYVMSGGYIRNAVLRAAFLAADEGERIGPHHLVQAAQLEYEAMGKLAASAA